MQKNTTLSYVFILSILAGSTSLLGGFLGNVLVISTYAFLILYILVRSDWKVELTSEKYVLGVVTIIYIIWVLHLVRLGFGFYQPWELNVNNREIQAMRAPAFIVISFVNIFIIPHYIHRTTFFGILSRVCSIIVLLGIPSMIVGAHEFLWLTFEPYTLIWPFHEFGIDIPAMTSFLEDSNALAKLAFFGFFGGLYEYMVYHSKKALVFGAINAFGVIASGSRGTFLSVFVLLSLYIIYIRFGRMTFANLTISGFSLLFVWILMVINVLPSINYISEIRLAGRGVSWKAAYAASKEYPLLGSGVGNIGNRVTPFMKTGPGVMTVFGVQSGYFRMLVTAGFVGLVLYVFLFARSVLKPITKITSHHQALLIAFCISLFVLQSIENFTIFEANKSSVTAAVTLGYILSNSDE